MQLIERSFNAATFRPKPIIHWELDQQLLIVLTNWGSADSARKMIEEISKFLLAAQGDVEVTTPFELMPQLTDQANSLRVASLLANQLIFRSDNRNDFVAGAELCLILKNKKQISWLQVGQPHLFLKRKNSLLQPLSIMPDLSFDIHVSGTTLLSPLPKDLIGVDSMISPQVGHCLVDNQDELVLISRSEIPLNLNSTKSEPLNLSELTINLSQENPLSPFWIGHIKLN